jgi:hypothetical protein
MFSRFACGLMAAMTVAVACARAEVALPDTPAGRALGAWLEAVNTNDLGRIQRFVAQYKFVQTTAQLQAFHAQTGGFELLSVQSPSPDRVKFTVREKLSPTEAAGTLAVAKGPSPRIDAFDLSAIPPGGEAQTVVIDRNYRRTLIRRSARS